MTELRRFPAMVVEQRHIEACARFAGGFGRIHLDPDFAATTRFGRPLVQGLLLAARIEQDLSDALPEWPATGGLALRFRRPVFAGDSIQTVIERSADGDLAVRLEARGTEDAVVGTVTRAAEALEVALGG